MRGAPRSCTSRSSVVPQGRLPKGDGQATDETPRPLLLAPVLLLSLDGEQLRAVGPGPHPNPRWDPDESPPGSVLAPELSPPVLLSFFPAENSEKSESSSVSK